MKQPNKQNQSETNIIEAAVFSLDEGDIDWSNAHANLLSSLHPGEIQDLLDCSQCLNLNPRDQLFRAGDRSDSVYVVAKGCIRLFRISPAGRETILWFNFPGEIFGIAELLSGNERQVYAAANEPSQVYSISRKDFADFLSRHPEAAMKAIGILSARVRTLGQMLVGLASDTVEARIVKLLMRLAAISSGNQCSAESHTDEMCVNVKLTHQDIANMVGSSRQTVSSILANLRKQGVLRTVSQHFHISHPDHLRNLLAQAAA